MRNPTLGDSLNNLSKVSQLAAKRIMSDSKIHFQQLVSASNGQIFSEPTLKFQVLSLAARMTTIQD